MDKDVLKQITYLKIYSAVLTIALLGMGLLVFTFIRNNPRFKEIEVERINVVEKTGKLGMVISNGVLQHPGIADGKTLPERERAPGMIFFNTDGDECGGLIYDGTKKAASFVLSIDKYRNDQIMQLQYDEEKEAGNIKRSYGLKFWDRPDNFTAGQLMTSYDSLKKFNNKQILERGMQTLRDKGLIGQDRMFVGKNQANQVGVFIKDKDGRPRINLYVDDNNQVVIQALDSIGRAAPLH